MSLHENREDTFFTGQQRKHPWWTEFTGRPHGRNPAKTGDELNGAPKVDAAVLPPALRDVTLLEAETLLGGCNQLRSSGTGVGAQM